MGRRFGPLWISVMLCFSSAAVAGKEVLPTPVSVRQVAQKFMTALQKGDVPGAEGHVISFEAFSAISKRGLDREAHKEKHGRFLASLAAAFGRGLSLESMTLKDVLLLPRSHKTRVPVVMAVFHATMRAAAAKPGQGQKLAMVFVQCQRGWKLMLRD